MKFKDLVAVELCANLLSAGGAIAMAIYGLDYWALVLRPHADPGYSPAGKRSILQNFPAFGLR
jgi:hypothetical protein